MASEVAAMGFAEKFGAVSFSSFTEVENALNQYMKENYVAFVRSPSSRSSNAVLRYEWVCYKCSRRVRQLGPPIHRPSCKTESAAKFNTTIYPDVYEYAERISVTLEKDDIEETSRGGKWHFVRLYTYDKRKRSVCNRRGHKETQCRTRKASRRRSRTRSCSLFYPKRSRFDYCPMVSSLGQRITLSCSFYAFVFSNNPRHLEVPKAASCVVFLEMRRLLQLDMPGSVSYLATDRNRLYLIGYQFMVATAQFVCAIFRNNGNRLGMWGPAAPGRNHSSTVGETECPCSSESFVDPKGKGNGKFRKCWKRPQFVQKSLVIEALRDQNGSDAHQRRTFVLLDTSRTTIHSATFHFRSGLLAVDRNVACEYGSLPRIQKYPSLGNLAVSKPSCFPRVAWQLGTERVLQLNDFFIFQKSRGSVDTICDKSSLSLNRSISNIQLYSCYGVPGKRYTLCRFGGWIELNES
ncbi:hypothetical protein CLF_104928 [Clonorchis sinensis]|uniref:Uncharacterized protein n=1 Tax=Clonorchis sinensis TaxID=79923 RepID=G7YCL9_CLOSI|nr:hypothetical protein CLF_104928 [Clonorchis sinensis]